ncbi:neprilysin-1-like [Amblyomma americanum]
MVPPQGPPPGPGFKEDKGRAGDLAPAGGHLEPVAQPDSFLNTCVTIVAVLIVITLIVMVVILLKCFSGREECPRPEGPYNPYSNVSLTCESEDCRDYGSMMRSSLISFMEPCEDFYEFTCGGWMKAARVPHEEVVHSTLSEVHRRVENEISDILNNTVISYRDQTATQKASALYQGCINIDLRNSKGTKPVEDLLQFFELANWPMLNRTAQFRTFFILGNIIRELGLDAIISVRVGLDYHNSDRYLIYIGQPSFGVEPMVLRGRFRSPFFRILHRYKIYIYRCALLMGANVQAADVVNEIVAFEAKLAAIIEPPDAIQNPKRVYNLMSLRTLEGAIPEIPWSYFINVIVRDVGVSMDLTDHVVVLNPLYLKRLSRLLKEVPSSAVANYLGWRLVQAMGEYATERFRRARFRFDRYRYLLQDAGEVPRECVRLTSRLLHFAVARLYFDRHISKPAERYRKLYDMAEELRDAFAVLIDLNTWMDADTKERARQKLHHLQMNIGSPPWIKSDRDLDEYYKDVPDLRKEEFFVSLLRTLKVHNRIMLAHLRRFKKAEDFGWIPQFPATVMHYSLLGNYMLLPVDYIQFPFFILDMPPPINFGALGTIMGQQLTYGFGEQGALYDERGKLVEWWSRETHRKFVTGARCLSEQYDQFNNPITGTKLSVNSTLDMSIADNAGLRLAFKSRCEVSRKRSMYFYLRPRDQIPNRFRTIIPLMNFERFAAIFGCKTGSIMNPDQKCIVW